ncbi:hypothetical protein A2U01_0077934, partial [Trifolium medium]|nr:hypothetical protein [Trifolium medium]
GFNETDEKRRALNKMVAVAARYSSSWILVAVWWWLPEVKYIS